MNRRLLCVVALIGAVLMTAGLSGLDRPLAEWVHSSGIEQASVFATGLGTLDWLAGMRLSFWLADPHRSSVQRQFAAGTTTFEFTKNYKFTILNNENVWAKAMNRVVSEKVPVDKAVDELIARIKQVAG